MLNNKTLKYASYGIVFQEVPDEVSLVINITGCPHKCKGCHSKYLWEDFGNFISDDLDSIINEYKNMISCVCFMGGDQNIDELNQLLYKIRSEYKLKTCLYSGLDNMKDLNTLINNLDYIKIGSYNECLGGLDNPATNQIFYKNINGKLENITYRFRKEDK